MDVKEMVKFMENLGYEVIKKEKVDIIDKLLGKFALEEEKTSTELLKELRSTGYGKYYSIPQNLLNC